MSGRLRNRQAANAASKIEENVNERILSECHALYADPKHGVSDYLSTEISTSREKRFGLVTFIDTPGLVDGDMKYEFDVERALLWLGESNPSPMHRSLKRDAGVELASRVTVMLAV
ncbi:UNVERIFIED_CONTAM: hypothetical protein FKN15_019602 [Acipenser sinensis]